MAYTTKFLSMDTEALIFAHAIFVKCLGDVLEEHSIPKAELADKLLKMASIAGPGTPLESVFEYTGVLSEVLRAKDFDFRDWLGRPTE